MPKLFGQQDPATMLNDLQRRLKILENGGWEADMSGIVIQSAVYGAVGFTSSTSYTDCVDGSSVPEPNLPQLTGVVVQGGHLLIVLTAALVTPANQSCYMSFDGTPTALGAHIPPSDTYALTAGLSAGSAAMYNSLAIPFSALVDGTYTITAKYRISGGAAGEFAGRMITAITGW